jgi:hypothetical protein
LIQPPAGYRPALDTGEPTPAEHPLRFIVGPGVSLARNMSTVTKPEAPTLVFPSGRTKATIEVSPVPLTVPVEPAINPIPSPDAGERKK